MFSTNLRIRIDYIVRGPAYRIAAVVLAYQSKGFRRHSNGVVLCAILSRTHLIDGEEDEKRLHLSEFRARETLVA